MLAAAALDATITHQQHKHPEQAALEVAAVAGQGLVMEQQEQQIGVAVGALAQQILEMARGALVALA